MSEDIKKVTPEELEVVNEVRSKYQEITVKLGQIQVQRMTISGQLEILNKNEEDHPLSLTPVLTTAVVLI